MFDASKLTILVQAAGGSGDWRMWHYVDADDDLEAVKAPGFFAPMGAQITPNSIVMVVAPSYVAQLVLVKREADLVTVEMCSAAIPAAADMPHVQGVPNQPGGNQPLPDAPTA